ncbi:MAG: hypothetical protein K6G45_02425 [Lachnospiraceae bacterium]|nr:hypothetical protein [Lachnospiraceae bacterium]MCR5767329.1 hypothetical protein [Lachnospiraceae bacterium]
MRTGTWSVNLGKYGEHGKYGMKQASGEERYTGGRSDYEDCVLVRESPGGYDIVHDGDLGGSCVEDEGLLLIDTDTYTLGRA